MRTIMVEGASTATGFFDMEQGGWSARLHKTAMSESQANPLDPLVVRNNAIPGNTLSRVTHDISHLERAQAIGGRANRLTKLTVILGGFGINESKMYGGLRPVVPLARFAETLAEYGSLTTEKEIPTIYVGPNPLSGARLYRPLTGATIDDEILEEYDAAIKEQALTDGMPYISTRELFVAEGIENVLDEDGLHPNTRGHEVLHHAVTSVLQEMGVTRPQ